MLFQFSLLCAHRADGSKGQRERWMGRRRRRRRVHACTLYSKPPLALFDPVFINSGKLNGAGGLSSAFSISFGLCPGSGGKFFFSKLHSFPAAAALWCLHMTPGGQSLCLNPLASAGRLYTHAYAYIYTSLSFSVCTFWLRIISVGSPCRSKSLTICVSHQFGLIT